MKPLSLRRLAVAAAWMLLLSAFTSPKEAPASNPKTMTNYYFYLEPSDSYDTFTSVANEIVRLEQMTGFYVDTSPFGGTLVANGFTNNDFPHDVWASVHLYAHH
jgi:hypothetical protein